MAKNITLLGASYSDVPAVQLPQTGGGTARFDDCSVVTAVASDVAQGKVFVASDGTVTTGTASGGGGNDFIVTLSYDSQSDMWTPDCTYAELYSAYSGGKSIAWVCDDSSVAYGYFAVNEFDYDVYEYFEDSDGEGFVVHSHGFTSSGVTDYGRTDKYYGVYDATALPTDVANGKIFYNANGRQTGTASGGGGADVPTFTFVWDDNWENLISSTCDKTYAQCMGFITNGNLGAIEVDRNESGSEVYTSTLNLTQTGTNIITYTLYDLNGAKVDFVYSSNGTINVVSPSSYSEALNITQNGTYTPSGKTISAVNVSVPSPSGSISITSNGTHDVTNYASAVVNVSGGGGASNFFTGTFKGSTAGEILNVDIPYTGSGYPLCAVIVPTGGLIGNSTFYNTLSRYAIGMLSIYKTYANTVPSYASSGTQNQCTVQAIYKNSSSTATSFTRTSVNDQVILYGTSADPSGVSQSVLFANATRMRVRIKSNSYGFMNNIEYTYYVIYSQ